MIRPKSVSIIGYFSIFGSLFSIFYLPFTILNQDPATVEGLSRVSLSTIIFINMLYSVINLVSGVGLIKRKEWGRKLIFISMPIFLAIGVYTSKIFIFSLFGLLLYLIYLFFLTREKVVEYFSLSEVEFVERLERETKKILGESNGRLKKFSGILVFIFGSFFLFTGYFVFFVSFIQEVNFIFFSIFTLVVLVIASALLIVGIFLWGKKRWKITLGTVLTVVGSFVFVTVLSLLFATYSKIPGIDQSQSQIYTSSSLVVLGTIAITNLLIGIGLIIEQTKKDKLYKDSTSQLNLT